MLFELFSYRTIIGWRTDESSVQFWELGYDKWWKFWIDISKRECAIVENVWIGNRFLQTSPLFRFGTKIDWRIDGCIGQRHIWASDAEKRGWPAKLVLQRPSQYIEEKSEWNLKLKFYTWILHVLYRVGTRSSWMYLGLGSHVLFPRVVPMCQE